MNAERKLWNAQFEEAHKLYEAEKFIEAFEKFLGLAEQGDPFAMTQVALMYGAGMGTEASFEESVRWDMQAANLGNETALFNLGITYRNVGDARAAKGWFERSLQAGNGEAALALAQMYLVSDLETERVRALLNTALASDSTEETRAEAMKLLSELE